MKAVVTRVKKASVEIDGKVHGIIETGFLVLLGVKVGDTEADALKLADKITALRVFEDENGKMNLGLDEVGGKLLVISQFTLYGNCKRGRRPEFLSAARPETAIPLYELFISRCRGLGFEVETGVFGADMQVFSQNDGPVTLILDSETL
ncbi:MAG TPA: D-tyrosyl-tRNA(Tyr) deacylase [Clostridiales bacterium]|jgi:D-tyrosyl-tRNA(Tyr) deacylase|nr:D-tyrosyl-tRNA(Tyr) deacylase [Clostridiales bacterium]